MVTKEGAVVHVTGGASGFFVNQSTDSAFNAAADAERGAVYPTLSHLLLAVSPAFAAWYAQRQAEGDQVEKIKLEELLASLRPLPSSNVSAQNWFAPRTAVDQHNLFSHAEGILGDESLPYLSSEVSAQKQWLVEYTAVKTSKEDADIRLYYAIEYENQFAEAATRGAMRIVDGGDVSAA